MKRERRTIEFKIKEFAIHLFNGCKCFDAFTGTNDDHIVGSELVTVYFVDRFICDENGCSFPNEFLKVEKIFTEQDLTFASITCNGMCNHGNSFI